MKNKSARTLDEYTNAMFNIRTDETEKISTEIINLLIGTAFLSPLQWHPNILASLVNHTINKRSLPTCNANNKPMSAFSVR